MPVMVHRDKRIPNWQWTIGKDYRYSAFLLIANLLCVLSIAYCLLVLTSLPVNRRLLFADCDQVF
jgi:hypothetical protein